MSDDKFNSEFGIKLSNKKALEKACDTYSKKYGTGILPAVIDNDSVTEGGEDWRVELSKVKLVDVSAASWDQIVEFRADQESSMKFIRLWSFFQTELKGKGTDEITAILHQQMDEYEQAVNKHGFEFSQKPIEVVATGALIAKVIGIPLDISSLTATGVAIFLSGLIAARRVQSERKILTQSHTVSYLAEAKSMLGP